MAPGFAIDRHPAPALCPGEPGGRRARPFLKWVGGKRRLLPDLCRRTPPVYNHYLEPFVGGGALFFELGSPGAYLADINDDLIHCYATVRDDVEAVIARVSSHLERHTEPYFYGLRDAWNGSTSAASVERAAAFIYLNKSCHGGVWRVGPRGFNVPWGRYKRPGFDGDILRSASAALRHAHLVAAPFEDVLRVAETRDFVYLDPPYDGTFSTYSSLGFRAADQRRLAEVAGELHRRGCFVLLSNSDTPLVRDLYRGWRTRTVLARRSINRDPAGRGGVSELLIDNGFVSIGERTSS